jgi:hypothetical protein
MDKRKIAIGSIVISIFILGFFLGIFTGKAILSPSEYQEAQEVVVYKEPLTPTPPPPPEAVKIFAVPRFDVKLTDEQKEKAIRIAEEDPRVKKILELLGTITSKDASVSRIVGHIEDRSFVVDEFYVNVKIVGENGSITVTVDLIAEKVTQIRAHLIYKD